MKINRRLIYIALASLVVSIMLTFFIYNAIKKVAVPEPTQKIGYFKYNMDKDTILKDSDVVFIETPVSLIPQTAIRSMSEFSGKRLVIKAEQGDLVLSGKLVERGDVLVDVRQLWTIGLDVTNISNYLGGNIKEGKEYILLYKDASGIVSILSEVKVANLIDSTGKLITRNGDGLIKTINVSVDTEEVLLKIAQVKGTGGFELISAPEDY